MSARARSVYVRGLPELSGLQDKVSGYFQSGSRSAGGAVTRVKLLGPGQALVTFVDETVAQNVLAQPQHTLHGTRIKVTTCPPHLDVPEESAEDTEETEKAEDKTEEGKEDALLSEEERKVEQAELEAVETKSQGSVKDLLKRFQSPKPMPSKVKAAVSQQEGIKDSPATTNIPRDQSPDSDYTTPPESPTPKRLPVHVCHESKIDESKPVIINSLLVQKQANTDPSDSGATSQHVAQLMAESCPFESLTETGQPEDDSPRTTGPPAPPEILFKKPKPPVPPKPSPKPTTSSTAPKETTATSLQHANTEGESIGDKQQEHHSKPTLIHAVTTETAVTTLSSQRPQEMCTASGNQLQQPFSKPATTSSASTETLSDSHQHPNLPSGSTGEQPHASPANSSSVPCGPTSASSQQPNVLNALRGDLPQQPHPSPTTTSSVPCGQTSASPQQPNVPNALRGDLPQQPHPSPTTTSSVPCGQTSASPQQPNVPNALRGDLPQQPHPNMPTTSSAPRAALPSPQHPNLPNTSMKDQPQQPYLGPQSTSSVTTETVSSEPSSIPNAPMEGQMQQPHPSPTTISSVPTGTTSPFPQQPNLLDAPREGLPQQPQPVTMSSAPGTASPSPLYPNMPNTSMGGQPQQQHHPFYHWPPPPHMGMMYPRQPVYPPHLPGSHAYFMPHGGGMPYGDPRHGFPWAGRGGNPPAGVQFQGQGHPASGPQSSFFPQASPTTTGGPQQVHYMSSGQPASSISLTAARSSPSSEVLHSYHHHQPSSSPSWGSPRTGSPVSLPLPQQDRSRGHSYLSDQASSVHSRQTPTDVMSVWSDGESTFVDASDSVSNVGSLASDADSFVTSRGRKETTKPLGAAAKSDHHPSYKERNRKDAKLKRKAPYTMQRGASKTDVQAKKPFVEPSRSIVVSGFTSAPDIDLLGLYFESEKRSGGGEVEEVKVRGTDEVIITFKDPSVTQRVLARKHDLNGQTLNVKEFTSSSEEAIFDTDTSPPSNITIQVSGFTSSPNKEMMMLYFENKKRSGGGEIQDIQVRDNKVFIVFKDPSVGRHVLSREHCLDETILRLKEVQPRSLDNTRLLVKGFKDSTTKETLSLYLENIGDDEVITVDYSTQPGVALVTFNKISNFDRMVTKAQSRLLEGQHLTIERVPITDAVIVTNLPDNVSRDLLELYFDREIKSSGGSVTEIKMDSSTGTAVVQFDDTNTVNSVHQKSSHILNNTPISVQPYYECLGEVVDDNAPEAFQMPQPINVKIEPQLILFVIAMPKFVEQLKSKLEEVNAEVDMTVTDIVTVSPTLTPEMKGVRKLAKLWEHKSRRCVEQFFSQFQATEITMATQIWERAKDRLEEVSEKVSTSNRDDVWIEGSDDKDGGGVVALIGTKEAVTEAELVCKTNIKETEALLKWEASIVTDHIANTKPAKLKILQLNNFTDKYPDVEIRLDVDNKSVDFKGQQALVRNAKIDLYETTNKMAEERVALSRGKLAYLKSDKGRKHLEDNLKKNDIKAAFAIENEEITILAQQFVEVKSAKDLLQQVVSESPVAIAEESRDLLTKQGFATCSTKLQQQLSVDIHIGKDRVWVVGPVEKVAAASKDIKTYIATNTIVTINMDVAEGKAKYLDCYRSLAVKDVEKDHTEQLVKIMIGQGKLTVKGTKDGTQSAKKQLQALINDVTTGTMNITKPGMHKFFTKGSGSGLLKGIEREVKCVIQVGGKPPGVPVRDMGGARAAAAPAAPGGLKQICFHTTERRKLVVVQGDLTSHRVDVMVNTANGSLSHGGGLAAAIVKAGGQEIQRDCTNYVKDNGKLTEGQVMSTKGYKLPCKMVVHAVGPLWIADQKDSREKVLKMAVENALLEARDYHSIAIPAISAGASGYPIKPCVAAIVAAVTAFFNTNPDCALSEVHFAEMDPQKTDAFRDELLNRFGRDKVTMTGSTDSTPSGPVSTPRPRAAAASPSNTFTTPEGINILLNKGNITAEKADVLVNTTSSDLDLSQGGVAKAFGQAGGQQLQQLCNNHGKANAGDIVITQPAGNLSCKQVYHAVLPNWQESDQPLRTMVQECLESADQDGHTSIAFPAMGTGNLKYPRDVAASCMYDEILSFSQDNPGTTTLQDVRIIVFDQPTVQAFETELRVRQGVPGASGTASGSGSNPAVTTPMPGQQQMTIGNVTLQIQGGDLTAENVDCIVNVTSKDLDLSGPMAKAICQKAGPSVAAECQQYITRNGQQDHGAVVLTGAGNLPYKGILHLAHPNTKVLKRSIKTCLETADKRGFRSICFPAVGTGGFKISPDQAASLMLDGVTDFAQKGSPQSLTTVRITVFQQQMLHNFHSEMDRRARGMGHKSRGFRAKVKSRFKKVAHSLGKKSRVAKILGFSSSDGKRSVGDTTTTPTSLLLHFYGTDRAVGVAKRRVQETVDENFKEEKIDDAAVLQLSADEMDMLKAYGQQNNVSIRVDQGGRHCITIQGISDVATVMSKVWEVLHAKIEDSRKLEQALSLQKDISWCYEQPDGTYVPFDPLINLQIEEAYRKNKKGKVQYEDDVGQCEIDFSTMKEKASGQVSNVRRDDLKARAVTSAVPSHWDPQPNDLKSGKPILCHLVKLKSSSGEYKTVSGKFGLGNVVSIERVQNPTLWSQYCAQKQKISLKNPGKNIEQDLWHGSSADSCVKIYHNGFNRSYAGVHGVAIGKGTYFAVQASYSAQGYASPDASGHKRLFLAKVLTGLSTPGNSSMIVPPPRPGGGPLDTYDSTSGSGMFCVFHDAQAYPEYLITFT